MAELWRRGKAPWEAEEKENEKNTESYLRNQIKAIGGKAYKFISPGNDGVPDRLIVFPGRRVVFVETKSEGKNSTPQQRKRQQELVNFGFPVFRDIDTVKKADQVVNYCKGLIAQ